MSICLTLFVILLFTGLPLFVNLGLTSFLYIFMIGDKPMVVVQRITQAANSFTMLACPFFILMGNFMNTSGVTRKLFRFANTIVGTVPGGMGHANIICSMLFAGMSGTAVADAGGDDYEDGGDEWIVYTAPADLMAVKAAIEEQGIECKGAEFTMIATTPQDVTVDEARKVMRLVDKLEELEDLQNVYHTMNITDEIAEALDED